jgi:hypothetical protein
MTMNYSCCVSQNKIEGIEIIHNIIQETQATNRIYYEDSILTEYTYKDIKNALTKRKYTSVLKPYDTTSFEISKKERKYILSQLELQRTKIWTENLLSNSEIIQADSAWAMLNKIRNIEEPKIFPQTKRIWKFIKPIVFRNGTCALVYYLNFCGKNCGFEEIAFYTREGENWKKIVRISAYVF